MLKLDSIFFSKIGIFQFRVRTLFRVMTSFYQRGRGFTFRGKWIISSQIGRGRWRISRVWRLVLPFKWTYFPNIIPREGLSTLNSWQGMEGRILSLGESIRQHLLNKTSPGDDIRGIRTPSRLGEGIWNRCPKLGSSARPNYSLYLYGACWLEGLGQSPSHPHCLLFSC